MMCEGAEGATLTIEPDRVVIDRTGFFARMRQGARTEIAIPDLVGVHLAPPPGGGLRGTFQLLVAGDTPGGFLAANKNPNTLYFNSSSEALFRRAYEYLNGVLAKKPPGNPPAAECTVLMITSNPALQDDKGNLRPALWVDVEAEKIRQELERTPLGRSFDLQERHSFEPEDLVQNLLEQLPDVLHFSGHGVVSGIVMEDESRGTVVVSPDGLALLLTRPPINSHLRLLVLNACLSDEQATYLANVVPMVIGTTDTVNDEATISFSCGFYNALGRSLSIEDAFQIAVGQVALKYPHDASLYRLHNRPDVDPSAARLVG